MCERMKTKEAVLETPPDNRKESDNIARTQLDNRMAKAKPLKFGWTSEQTESITSTLNLLLANYAIHQQRLRSYHWNVKGRDFFDLHPEFENQYKEASVYVDALAERIRFFGKAPFSTMQEFLNAASLQETSGQLTAELMVRELLSDYRILAQYMADAIAVAIEQGDYGTEEIVKENIRSIEQYHWMLSSFMAQ